MRRPASRVISTTANASRVVPIPTPRRIPAIVAALAVACACSLAVAVEPVFWRQRVFFIPYQPAPNAPTADKVQLLVARDGAGEWAVLQEAEPHVRGFSYHAPSDGDYSFAVRTVDRKGNVSPTMIAQPQLRVVVDTAPPALQLSAALDATGRVVARYEARDIQLRPETLKLEVQTAGAAWERIATGPPDISQPDRVAGQLAWKPPTAAGKLQFRATIEDRAGNHYATTADASLIGPLLSSPDSGPALNSPMAGASASLNSSSWGPALGSAAGDAPPLLSATPTAPPSNSPPTRPGIEWPASPNSYGGSTFATPVSPPLWPEQRTPAQLVADNGASAKPSSSGLSGLSNPFGPPPLLSDARTNSIDTPIPLPPIGQPTNSSWHSAATESSPAADGVRWVNSTTFDVDYDLQTVGPWGVSKVELWATRDGGREWVNFGLDNDNRSPMRVTVPAAGVYGFRLIVSGANGAAVPTPASGDQPELVIGVDLQEPQGDLQAAEIGQGNLADHLLVRWTASDENLEARPIGLFYAMEPQGPWSTIATDIDNSGQYAWRLLRQVPQKLFLRLEIRDKAGNVAIRTSPAPVVLNLPQPTGRLRSVRPVQEDPSRFRTALGHW
jgi:hypothetical protein